jgi:hypothetical protein
VSTLYIGPIPLDREAWAVRGVFDETRSRLMRAGMDKAELGAARAAVAYAIDRGFVWDSIREALADWPGLLKKVPEGRYGKVDSLCFGEVHVRKDRVVRQGTFVGRGEEMNESKRRVVQICSVDNGEGVILSAVADDGSVWCFRGDAWVRMPELPQREGSTDPTRVSCGG